MCGNCLFDQRSGVVAAELGVQPGLPGARSQGDTILIIEDKALCRAGMGDLLALAGVAGRPAFAASLKQAMECRDMPAWRIALVHLAAIDFDFEGLRRLAAATKAPIVVIDERPNPTYARLARQAGARGYICKTFEMEQVRGLMRAVQDGAEHFPPDTRLARPGVAPLGAAGLSPRQLEVLNCVALGMSNQEIGRALGITVGTVKLHVHAILQATRARNRMELALIANRFQIPTPEN